MAFRNSTFYPVGNQSGRTHAPQKYIYRTDDTLADITANGYFSSIASKLSQGDEIEVQFVTFTSATDDSYTTENGKTKLQVAYKDDSFMHVMDVGYDSSLLIANMTDVSTAGGALGGAATAGNADITAFVSGTVTEVVTILNGAIATANDTVTVGNNTTSTAFTDGTNPISITVTQVGSGKGNVDNAVVGGGNDVNAGDIVRFISDGASDNVVSLTCIVKILS